MSHISAMAPPNQPAAATADAGADTASGSATQQQAAIPAAAPANMHITFSELQQQLPHNKGLDLLWAIAQQVRGASADPAAVEVSPILLLWAHPATLQDCRDSFRTDSPAQSGETLLLLSELQQLLQQPLMQQVLGQQQQQQLLADITELLEDCRVQLQEHHDPEPCQGGDQSDGGPVLHDSPARESAVYSADSLTLGSGSSSLADSVSLVMAGSPSACSHGSGH